MMYETNTVNEIIRDIPEAGRVLRTNDVVAASTSNHISLAQAAESVSTTTDEMLAVMEYRVRRAARPRK